MSDKTWKILIVDDDDFLREINTDVFKEAKFQVFEAHNGEEGFQSALTNKPDLIYTGIQMPKMTGFEMIKKLKQLPDFHSVPFMIFSHLGHEEDRKQAHDMGAKAFIVKGFTRPIDVVRQVRNILTGQIYRVAINPDILDAKLLMHETKGRGAPILELIPDPEGGERAFKARFIFE